MCNSSLITFGQAIVATAGYGLAICLLIMAACGVYYFLFKQDSEMNKVAFGTLMLMGLAAAAAGATTAILKALS